ncbi:uncharacterized protein LOC134021460 isoform X1 [Osmerus eperlanus]|uniref:uncharacterized protein LOC134021460 isoform X1 n=1 Tax=Osmerus eperlanus TaxID=29151 RepID=UPI002E13EE73
MTEKPRQLPSWMAVEEKVKVKSEEHCREQSTTRKRTKKKLAGRTVYYCMNEKELVEAAIAYLGNNATGEKQAQQVAPFPPLQQMYQTEQSVTVPSHVKTKDSFTKDKRMVFDLQVVMESSDSEVQERTRASETDIDIVEEKTLPYPSTSLPEELPGTGGQSKGPGEDYRSLVDPRLEREKPEGHSLALSTAADDDGLQLVRDIFFT